MGRDSTWNNPDGLIVGFGPHSDDNQVPAVVSSDGLTILRVQIDLADSNMADVATALLPPGQQQAHRIPRGSTILRAGITVRTAATSSSAGTLDIGTWSRGVATEVVDDAIGIHDAYTVAEMTTVGEFTPATGNLIGADVAVGATSNSDCVIVWSYDTAVFQAGVVELYVEYLAPQFARTITA
jgi:hypothetical protein